MSPAGILETVLYAKNLAATETFYRDVLGLEPFVSVADRHLFYRCGNQVLLYKVEEGGMQKAITPEFIDTSPYIAVLGG